jgi:hypothetical protein
MTKTSLEVRKQGYQLDKPMQMVGMAKVLKNHIVGQQLYTNIQGKNYAHVEGWQFAGGLLGMFPRVVTVENLSSGTETKWKADVEIINLKTGDVVSRGFAVCSNKEGKKKSFDEYAVLSMAQTRAIGKAYRNCIGWVMKLAGYETTPSEEMPKPEATMPTAPSKTTEAKPVDATDFVCHGITKSGCGTEITKQEYDYSIKMYGKPLCREHQKEAKPITKSV